MLFITMKKKINSKLKNIFDPDYELSPCEEIIFWIMYSNSECGCHCGRKIENKKSPNWPGSSKMLNVVESFGQRDGMSIILGHKYCNI